MTTTDAPFDLAGWFARRTFSHTDFADLDTLSAAKRDAGLTVSVCLPARNEAATVGLVVSTLRKLMDSTDLIDELVVMDGGSTDGTTTIAAAEGAEVFSETEVLPETGPGAGKGEGLWKSVHACTGDVLVWVDTDITNIDARFVTGLIGPLLTDPSIGYVKAFYERPLRAASGELQPSGGGRVTELLARPLLNAFWPELAGLVQPLSGEFAGRRELVERIPFAAGYGVELGLLLDILRTAGPDAIAQVDLELRVHRNQDIAALSRMSAGILQTALGYLADEGRIAEGAWAADYTQFLVGEDGRVPETRALTGSRRPPMATIDGYRRRREALAG
jgi:glucosyl-3-phosphoglycerate synthase